MCRDVYIHIQGGHPGRCGEKREEGGGAGGGEAGEAVQPRIRQRVAQQAEKQGHARQEEILGMQKPEVTELFQGGSEQASWPLARGGVQTAKLQTVPPGGRDDPKGPFRVDGIG